MRPAAVRSIWRSRLRPFWRLEAALYEGVAARLTTLGENFLVLEAAAESRQFFGELPKMAYLEALALARAGSPQRCLEMLVDRGELLAGETNVPDIPWRVEALRGRVCKDGWKATGDARLLSDSFEHYLQAYRQSGGDPFPGVNAASMAFLAGRGDHARTLAGEVRARLGSAHSGEDYWAAVTRAECSLILGEIQTAHGEYRAACAAAEIPRGNLITTRAQARLLLAHHGGDARTFDDAFALPNVACFSGHRTDDPDRESPRFPENKTEAVAARLREILLAHHIRFGFSSAARGGDILFSEAIRALPEGETNIFIPGERETFRRASVDSVSGPSWDERFEQALAEADEVTTIDLCGDEPQPVDFDYCNRLTLGAAMFRARELDSELTFIALWDGRPGPRGGTADAVRLAREAGLKVEIVNPMQPEVVSVHPGNHQAPGGENNLFAILVMDLGREAVPRFLAKARWNIWDSPLLTSIFTSTEEAVLAAKAIMASGEFTSSKIALHFAPLDFLADPAKDTVHPSGIHLKHARDMHGLCLPQSICASAEFAAATRFENSGAEFEYIGRLTSPAGIPDRQVYRLTLEPRPAAPSSA
jgi:hypothetical protein